jgi:hypothetical protein
MREAAVMLSEIGMKPQLANAIADIQEALARKGAALHDDLDPKGRLSQWRTLLSGADAGWLAAVTARRHAPRRFHSPSDRRIICPLHSHNRSARRRPAR